MQVSQSNGVIMCVCKSEGETMFALRITHYGMDKHYR